MSEDPRNGHRAQVWGADGQATSRDNTRGPQTFELGEAGGLWVSKGRGWLMSASRERATSGQGQRAAGKRVPVSSPLYSGLGCPGLPLSPRGSRPWPGTQGTAWRRAAHAHLGRREPRFPQRGLRVRHTPSPPHHHSSMIPLHLLPK